MVKIIGVGRLTRDPEVSYNKKGNGDQLAVARFTLAVKRPYVKEGQQDTDFLPCVVFGKPAETAEKHLSKGAKVAFEGRPQSSTYKDKDGKTIYTTDVIVEEHEFAQNKDSGAGADSLETLKADKDGFMEAKDGENPFD